MAFLPRAAIASTVKSMPTVATKTPARKAATKRSAKGKKTTTLRAVDASGRFILGYGKDAGCIRPGADLTKPTLPPGKYFA